VRGAVFKPLRRPNAFLHFQGAIANCCPTEFSFIYDLWFTVMTVMTVLTDYVRVAGQSVS
jgi:hypothetical protein